MEIVWIITGGLVVLFLGLSFFFTRYAYRLTFLNGKKKDITSIPEGEGFARYADEIHELIGALADAPFEPVEIRSRDGLLLKGRYYHRRDGAPVVLMAHGYRSSGVRDSGGGYRLSGEMGLNVLLIEQRANGISEGKTVTFGAMEKLDCRDWAAYLARRFPGVPIILYGASLGAATVLLATETGLPDEVRCVLADSGYTSGEAIISKVCRDLRLPVGLTMFFVRLSARLWGHFSLRDADVTEAMRRCRIPVLFLHGEADGIVPCEMSRVNYDACASADKEILTIPGADHVMGYFADNETYCRTVKDFIRKHL
ncbi:MAG: alpha/beta hydrolase [Eubacteriales bacterium]|nr:alpha/beta hydrolase [Eubacteriales bacterium]